MSLYSRVYEPTVPENMAERPPKTGVRRLGQLIAEHFWDLVTLNLVFVLYCLPIVTIGPALGALSHTLQLMTEDALYTPVWSFRQAFRHGLRKNLALGLLQTAAAIVFWGAFTAYLALVQLHPAFLLAFGFLLALGVVLLMMNIYIYPLSCRTALNLRGILRNAALMGIACIKQAAPAALCCGALLGLLLLYLPLTLPLLLFCGFSIAFLPPNYAAHCGILRFGTAGKH